MKVIFILSILKISNFSCIYRRGKAKYYNRGQLQFSTFKKKKIPGKLFQKENFYLPKPGERKFRCLSSAPQMESILCFPPAKHNQSQLRSQKTDKLVDPLHSSLHFPCPPYSCIFISSSNIVFYPIILSGYSSITSCAFPRHLYSPCTQFFFLGFMFCHKLLVLLPQSRVS